MDLCLWTFCPHGRFYPCGCFVPRMICLQMFFFPWTFCLPEVLSLWMFCPTGRFAPPLLRFSLRTFCPWLFCLQTLCLRTFCLDTVKILPIDRYLYEDEPLRVFSNPWGQKKLFSKSSSSNVHTKKRHFLITYGKSTPSGVTTGIITLSVAIAAIGMLQKLLAEIGTPLKIIMKIWC
jgi:hypothetical protein